VRPIELCFFESDVNAVIKGIAQDNTSCSSISLHFESPQPALRDLAQSCMLDHVEPNVWNDEIDFIVLRMDSLPAIIFRRVLDASLRNSDHPTATTHSLSFDIICSYPSVFSLATALGMWLQGSLSDLSTTEEMQNLFSR